MKILFINACVRKDSRTLRLCHHYLNLIKQTDPLKNYVIQTVNLQEKELRPLNEESLKLREEDKQAILEDEVTELVCHYCNEKYHFSREELQDMFEPKDPLQ